jgi:hypothetical protein
MNNGLGATAPSTNMDVASTSTPAPQAQESSQPSSYTSDASTSSVSTEQSTPVSVGKIFTEDQMKIISNNSKRAGEREAEARLRAQYEQQNAFKPSLNAQEGGQQGEAVASQAQETQMPPTFLSEEQRYQNYRQRQQRELAELQQQQIASDFVMKVQASGKGEKIESSGIGNLPSNHPLIPMLNSLDNIGDVLDDFESSPVKVANLLAVTYLNPMNGFKELQAISTSIKRNKEALAKEKAPPPISQLKPSTYGLSGGEQTVADKRKNKLFKF